MSIAADRTAAGAHHDPHLAHHFETPGQQAESAKLGMWLFLATEILFFGGLFCAYAVYRGNHPEVFIYAHQFLDKILGGINTLVLICSSLTIAWAVRAAQLGKRKRLVALLTATVLLATTFLGIKYVEYKAKWEHGLLWGASYPPTAHEGAPEHVAPPAEAAPAPAPATPAGEDTLIPPAPAGPGGLAAPAGGGPHVVLDVPTRVSLFFSIYFVMTGLHGIHVILGIAVILWLIRRARRGDFDDGYATPVDNVGLYWHLVDLIWIYLFPLLYLIH